MISVKPIQQAAPCPLDQTNRQFQHPGTEQAGLGFYLCRELDRLRLRGLRYALAETSNGIYEAEVIHRHRGQSSLLRWHESTGSTIASWSPPTEAEAHYYAMPEEPAMAA
ncbi:hypothetical protein [Mesorhizobium sp.]|uniref:hypothetical protein n=1 Tax=Mesorhizobium sp. TaxID=1871066 RepID=UPI0025DCC1F0|nr:hypothetical protein [Mesorhizobium sp.]